MKELDKLMAKLDQDNKTLAELDLNHQKVRTTANVPYNNHLTKQPSSLQTVTSLLGNTTQLHSSLPTLHNTLHHTASNLLNLSSFTNKNLLSALDTTNDLTNYSNYSSLNPLNQTTTGLNPIGITNLSSLPRSYLDGSGSSALNARQALSQPTLNGTSALTSAINDVATQQKQLQQQIQQQIQQQQQLLNSSAQQQQQQQLLNSTVQHQQQQQRQHNLQTSALNQTPTHQSNEMRLIEDIVDSIEIANRGRFRVYIARYSYDPFKQSPNEHPEAELHLNAGDFLLISDGIDEDGFFFGEQLDGRKGLIPCNFIEKLTGEGKFWKKNSIFFVLKNSK